MIGLIKLIEKLNSLKEEMDLTSVGSKYINNINKIDFGTEITDMGSYQHIVHFINLFHTPEDKEQKTITMVVKYHGENQKEIEKENLKKGLYDALEKIIKDSLYKNMSKTEQLDLLKNMILRLEDHLVMIQHIPECY